MRYFLQLSYDGGGFHGWQRQPNAVSVQQTIEDALSTIMQQNVEIKGAGRTDTGVHARQMFAHLDLDDDVDTSRLLKSANYMVGHGISLQRLIPTRKGAHARFDAISRTYSYYITMRKDPFLFPYTHFLSSVPDVGLMNEGGKILIATEDFSSFAKLHTDVKTNICHVSEARWELDEKTEILKFTITADRFLRNMVRAVVGTLLDLGRGKFNLDGLQSIIQKKNRCDAGMSMPAKGLFLERIVYPSSIFLNHPV